jgi:hypothetical protein
MDWIQVKERLPERDGTALVFARGIVTIEEWSAKRGWYPSYRDDAVIGVSAHTITHWMPLPEPSIAIACTDHDQSVRG